MKYDKWSPGSKKHIHDVICLVVSFFQNLNSSLFREKFTDTLVKTKKAKKELIDPVTDVNVTK